MTPFMRAWVAVVGCFNLFFAWLLHNDVIGYSIGAACLLIAVIA